MTLIPFEPVIPFTLGSLIVWYMLLLFCASLGALITVFCESVTNTKIAIGSLYGGSFYYALSWLFQSRMKVEFAGIFKRRYKMKLWIIGKVNKLNHKQWEFQGVFDDEPVAAALCVDETWFVGPVYLNERAPLETTVWPGAYYPRAKNIDK